MNQRGFVAILALLIGSVILIFALYKTMGAYGVLNRTNLTENINSGIPTTGSTLDKARSVQNIVNSSAASNQ
jgi:hypothetical protein